MTPFRMFTGGPAMGNVGSRDESTSPRWGTRLDGFVLQPDLIDAVNVALALGRPLLLTGEPGVGKSLVAYIVGREFDLDVYRFNVKSRSVASDLLYTYDHLRRLHASQHRDFAIEPQSFISYQALGLAILRSMPVEQTKSLWPDGQQFSAAPRRSIVLIDSIDCGSRDFANDILSEIETLSFRVPELAGAEIVGDPALAPIIFVTSNLEKSLPDAFLRRCVYFDVPFPDRSTLDRIVEARLAAALVGQTGLPRLCMDAIEFHGELRRLGSLARRPGTGELLDWLHVLRDLGADFAAPLREMPSLVSASVAVLAKTSDDAQVIQHALMQLLETRRQS